MNINLFKRQLARCGQNITLQDRDITPPGFDSIDFDESFSTVSTVKAIPKTIRGKTFFDGVSTEYVVTHEFRLEYISGITPETWILFNGRRIDILNTENCNERDQILILTCTDRGTGEAAKA